MGNRNNADAAAARAGRETSRRLIPRFRPPRRDDLPSGLYPFSVTGLHRASIFSLSTAS